MNKNKIWLSSPHMGGAEQKYVNEAFDTNWVAPLGLNVNGFEQDLKQYLIKNVQVAALSSGTAALHLALKLACVEKNDYVLCQSNSHIASANPIIYQGAIPVFVDSEPDTWNISPELLETAILDLQDKGIQPKAVVVAHLYGMPAKMDEINTIATKYGLKVIEDAAEALGSTYKGSACGTLGDYGILSFNGNKIITTSGGGALVTKSEADKQKAIFWATQARDVAPHYQHSEIGYNYRMSNIVAGIGRGQMQVLDLRVQQRRNNFAFYKEALKDLPIAVVADEGQDFFSNRWLSTILTHSFDKREQIRLTLADENIEARPLWKPMHLQPVFKDAPAYVNGVSEDLFARGLCLPSGSNLTDADRARILDALLAVF